MTVVVQVRCGATVRRSPHGRGRFAATSGLSALLAVAGHVAGGGALPTSCAALITALVVGIAATWAAGYSVRRTRGPWAVLAALAVGQLGIEALLSVPVDALPPAPLATATVHAAATLALGVVLLGIDRTVDDLLEALDRVLPRWWRVRATPTPSGPEARIPGPAELPRLILARHPRSLRGPPALT